MATKADLEKQVKRLETRLKRVQVAPPAVVDVEAVETADEAPSQPAASWRAPALAGSAGVLCGFGAAAILTGNLLVGAAAPAYLAWSVLFGLFVLVPWVANATHARWIEWLTGDSPEHRESKRLVLITLLGEATLLLRRERGLPKEQRIGAAFARELWEVLGEDAESTVQGHLGAVAGQVKQLAGGGDIPSMIAQARAGGMDIDPRLEKGLRTVDLISRIASRFGGGGGGEAPRPGLLRRGKRPDEGIGGYG